MTPADDVLENEANDGPGNIVDSVGGRNGASAGENDREAGRKGLAIDENSKAWKRTSRSATNYSGI